MKKKSSKETPAKRHRKRTEKGRAPRGALDKALSEALSAKPGLKISDYEKMVAEIDNRISTNSVGNTLRRLEGTKYRQTNGKWYLKG